MTGSRRIGAARAASLLAVVLLGASCGGGSSATPDGGTGAAGTGGGGGGTPTAQCKELVSTLCSRDNTCNMLGATAKDQMDCVTANTVSFGCDRATVSFAECLADAKAVSCQTLFPPDMSNGLPGACIAPLSAIPLSVAQQKCQDMAGVICERLARCQHITLSPTDLADCTDFYFGELSCAFVIDVSPTYDQCKQQFPDVPCQDPDAGVPDGGGPSLPVCDDVFVYPI